MQDNNILIDFKLSKSKLNQYIQEGIDQYHDTKITMDGYEIHLKKSDNQLTNISARQKSVFADITVAFTFLKNAGLFSVEGEGSISVQLEIKCDIDQNFGLKTTTLLHAYQWEKSPILHVGQLNIPIETLSSCVLNYLKDSLTEKLDKRLSETADIKKIINEQLQQYATNFPVNKKPDLFFNGQLLQVQSGLFREDENEIHLDIWLEISGKISDQPIKFVVTSEPTFYWVDTVLTKNSQHLDIEISYQGLAKMMMTAINGQEIGGKNFELESVNIRNTDRLEIKANMLEPIKGIITLTCAPFLDRETQKLSLGSFKIDIDASNFIYKISSPIIEKIISNKIMAIMPFDPAPYLKTFLAKSPQISLLDNKISLIPSFSQLLLDQLSFTPNCVLCNITLEDAELDVIV